jgi:uncharacterized coiled-coil protein SlyX
MFQWSNKGRAIIADAITHAGTTMCIGYQHQRMCAGCTDCIRAPNCNRYKPMAEPTELEERIAKLERELARLRDETISELDADVGTLQEDLSTLQDRVTVLENERPVTEQ